MQKGGAIYILTNYYNRVLYVGVTSDLKRRIWEHRNHVIKGFTKKFNVDKLVYFEIFGDIEFAIWREKKIKAGSRSAKERLIADMNPDWKDLYDKI